MQEQRRSEKEEPQERRLANQGKVKEKKCSSSKQLDGRKEI